MRVFVTGATGFIGSAIVQELLRAGHQVTGLARSEESARQLRAVGVQAYRGTLDNPDSLREGAAASDGVIHTAFIHDFSKFKDNCEVDRKAIETMGDVLVGSNRPLIITSGTALLNPGRLATEADKPTADAAPRVASEEAAASVADRGVKVSVIRLPPSVHGVGDHGFVPLLINLAREKGASAYIGDGYNRWPSVHRLDAALLYRLVLEKGIAGSVLHGVADEGVPFRAIAGILAKHMNLPLVSKSPDKANAHFGWFTHFAAIDSPASSEQTRKLLGWEPKQPDLLTDLDSEAYFHA